MPIFLHISILTRHVCRHPRDKKTILDSFTVLIDHIPWMEDMIPTISKDTELLKEIESTVGLSLYVISFTFGCV